MGQQVKADNVRLHFYVSKQLSDRVEAVGAMLGHAKARAAAFLLDNASRLEDQAIKAIDRRLEGSTHSPAPASVGDGHADSAGDDIVLMYVRLPTEVAQRIERLAKQRGLSLSRVCAWLLNSAAEDERWIVSVVQARLAEALAPLPGAGSVDRRPRHDTLRQPAAAHKNSDKNG